jgi:site-specific recombinase XerD
LLQHGYDIRTVQELLGHKDVKNHDDLHSCP